ncbi:argininosuccinate lyase [Buchnera aphidicola (Nipponaphis monzeni)]|uniref:Argininosuccinate lyase n=1 Tax=Buchnera aphidicola (Nipponaphis monzeni) TaxID=2495405 RepID=A0A455T9Q3_9GAMM|nr:argininosuccinate lyase [Buchnera aphidicola]BBI01059.1 argininosuccinate lyase [Buchnera aphidicola (Nipponaphis monzeni)]
MLLWGGRFTKKPNIFFKQFNDSLKIDYKLLQQEILASIAWSKILVDSKILSEEEQKKIEHSLKKILKKTTLNSKSLLSSNSEDIHSWIENQLINDLGNLGKKIHTGRSRNEQITTDLKLWCKIQIINLISGIKHLKKSFVELAENTYDAIMPGYTHLQRAQPITFSHWCLAYFEMLKRDESRLNDTLKRTDVSPLGSGALAGTTLNIDRYKLAKLMNFKSVTANSLDSVSDRDYVVELLSVASISMLHLSRFSEDLIFFNSGESNFIELSDNITTGSSLMPQKKNPDALEIIRSKCGRVYGSLISILVILKGLPLSYNKDMQEDKEGLFDAITTWNDCLKMSCLVLKNIKINYINCKKAARMGYSNATELADYLVSKGISFRESHSIAGRLVLHAIKENSTLESLPLFIFKKYSEVIEKDIYRYLSIDSLFKKRNSIGGVSSTQIKIAINQAKKELLD